MQYVLIQRILPWQIVKGFDQVKLFYENITSDNSKDGYAFTIKKYTTDDNMVNYSSRDVNRVKNTAAYINQLQEEMASLKTDILTKKAGLFDNDNNVKAWKENELTFYDKKIKQLVEMEIDIATIYRKLQNLSIVLHKKFFSSRHPYARGET